MCRVMCPTTFPLASEVTRRLLSQCPPLKSSFPSGDTASVLEQRSAPGAKGPCRKRWVLVGKDMGQWQSHERAGGTSGDPRRVPSAQLTLRKLTLRWRRWGLW